MKKLVFGVALAGVLAVWLERGRDSMFLGLEFYPYWLTIIFVFVMIMTLLYSTLVRLILRKPERIRWWNKKMARIVGGTLASTDGRLDVTLKDGHIVASGLSSLTPEQLGAVIRGLSRLQEGDDPATKIQ